MSFLKPSVRQLQLMAGAAILLLLPLGYGLHQLAVIGAAVRTIHEDRLVPLTQLKQVSDGYAIRLIDLVNKANAGRLGKRSALAELSALRPQIEQHWQAYLGTELTEREHRLIAEAAILKARIDAEMQALKQRLEQADEPLTGQLGQFDGPLYERVDPLTSVLASLTRLQRDVATEQHDDILSRSGNLQAIVGGSMAIAVLAILIVVGVLLMQLLQQRRLRELAANEHELKQYNQALQQQVMARTNELQQVVGELDSVQLAVREELQTPATDVHQYLDELRTQLHQQPNAHWLALVERATQAVDRMNLVLGDLLALSRLEQNQLRPEELSLSVLLEQVLSQYPAAVRERLRLTLQPLPSVYGDRGLLAQLLQMLLDQAIANTNRVTLPQLTVSTHRGLLGQLAVEFCDNGAQALPPELSGAGEPGYSNERSTRLAVCTKIAHLHGGRIWLESQSGQGGCVYFSLPDMQLNLHAA